MKKTHVLALLGSLAAAALAVTACSPMKALDLLTPETGYTRYADLAYGPLPRQKLDVYVPAKPDAYHSVVVFFYGGSWQMGDKALYRFVGQSLASQGFMTIIADYRLYPQAYFPAYAEDAAQAVVWAHRHAAEYGGDVKHLYVAGHSAGAHLAMLVTLDDRYLKEAGGRKDWLKGTIGIAGPYDFLPLTDPDIKALFSKVPLAETQPINFVAAHEPPILLLHGDADTAVGLKNSANLARKLGEHGNSVVFKTYNGVDHIGIAQALSVRFETKAPTTRDMVEFINATNAQ